MYFSWREKRKYFFILILIIFLLSYSFYKLYPSLFPAPTCNDGKQNLDESGIDCGGGCILVCPREVLPLEVKFAKAIKTEKDFYDLVAFVTNKNKSINTFDGSINYYFTIYDKAGSVMKVIKGTSIIPLGQDFPIILQNIFLPLSESGNSVSNISFTILDNQSWRPSDSSFSNIFFKTISTDFQNGLNNGIDLTRLSAKIQNLSNNYFRNFKVATLIYDVNKNLIAVNETVIDEVNRLQVKDIFYTWRESFSAEPVKIDVYPIITPYTSFK